MGRLSDDQKAILRTSGWLSTRSPAFQEAFLDLGSTKTLKAGDVLYHRGKVPTHVHGLIRGQIDVQIVAPNGEELVYPSGRQNKWYSFADVIAQEPAVGLAIARQPSDLLSISRQEVLQFLNADPHRYVDIIAHDNALRRQIQSLMAELVTGDGVDLVVSHLGWLVEEDRLDVNNAIVMSQLDLATAVGVSVPTVQRAFRDMKRRGILETSYGRLHIKEPAQLRHLVETLGTK